MKETPVCLLLPCSWTYPNITMSASTIFGNTEDLKLGEADDSYSAGQVNLDPEDLISRFLRLSRQDKITISSIVNYLLYYHSTRKD